jgi:hypothetical protein
MWIRPLTVFIVSVVQFGQIANAGNFIRAWRSKARYAYVGDLAAGHLHLLTVGRFVWMTPSGEQLQRIGDLVDAGGIRPMVRAETSCRRVLRFF